MSSEYFKCRCKCYAECEPKRECECKPKYRECECERDHSMCCKWFEKQLKEAYWRGVKDGLHKCKRKENEGSECEKDEVYEDYENYK